MYVPSPTEKDPQKIARGVRGAAELFASGQFVVLENSDELGNERKLTAGDGITLTDGGAGGNITIAATVAPIEKHAFLAYNSATDSNVTGDGTFVNPVDFDTVVLDE